MAAIDFTVDENNIILDVDDDITDISTSDNISKIDADDSYFADLIVEDDVVNLDVSEATKSGTSNYNDLINKPSINGVTLKGDKTTEDLGIIIPDPGTTDYDDLSNRPSINNVVLTGNLTAEDLGIDTEYIHDLGDFSMEDYGWDFWAYLDDIGLTKSGFYKAHDTTDDFDYFVRVEAAGAEVYQEYWYTEEGSFFRYMRRGADYGDGFEWLNYDSSITQEQAWDWFAPISHNHYIEETVSQANIETYLNGFNMSKAIGSYKIINSRGGSIHYVDFDYRYAGNAWRYYQKWIASTDDYIRVRFGVQNGSSVRWDEWRYYPSETIISNNYYNMDTIDEMLEDFAPTNMIETTWAELVELRDNAELVPGAYYRITDYTFVTTKTAVHSGNHRFDIVLLAISESMLSENAYAAKNANDHYFEREVTTGGIQWLYTLYVDWMGDEYGDEPTDHGEDLHASDEFVDADVMTHPDTGDDVPVLFKTNIEEYSVDDPDYGDAYFYEGVYDFDGDDYDMWSKWEWSDYAEEWIFAYQYALTPIVVEDGELIVSPHQETKLVPVNMNAWELKYCLDNDKALFEWAVQEGKGVIYYMKDEFGNEAPYDFKNATFQRKKITAVGDSNLNPFLNRFLGEDDYYQVTCGSQSDYFYTFVDSMNPSSDGSLFGVCNTTIIAPYIVDGQRVLNNVVCYDANNSSIGANGLSCTLVGFSNVTIAEGATKLLLYGLGSSRIGAMARSSTFYGFSGNAIGRNFSNNIGSQFSDNVIGDMCQGNMFSNNVTGNNIGNAFTNNTFGTFCYSNRFGKGISQCSFGSNCSYNTLEGQNSRITFTNYYRYNTIEQAVSTVTLNTSGGNSTNYVQYVKVCRGVTSLTIQPTRRLAYETIFYKTGRTETEV